MRIFVIGGTQQLCLTLRQMLALEPEFCIVGEVAAANASLDDCPAQVVQVRPDLVLLDWDLTDIQARAVLHALQSVDCPPKVVAFSECCAAHQQALDAGAVAFVCREDPMEQLVDTLLTVGGLSQCLLC